MLIHSPKIPVITQKKLRKRRVFSSFYICLALLVILFKFQLGLCLAAKSFPDWSGLDDEKNNGLDYQVVRVKNLNDSGPGSLRDGLNRSGARFVVFDVGGEINLESSLQIVNPFLVIDGYSAPTPGITLKNYGIVIATNDVKINNLFIRIGDVADQYEDCITMHGEKVFNILIENCSLAFAKDEQLSIYEKAKNITVKNCIISEARGERHGVLVGNNSKNILLLRNIFINNDSRNPALKGGTSVLFINNVIYNAAGDFSYIHDDYEEGPVCAVFYSNVYLIGPDYDYKYNGSGILVTESVSSRSKIFLQNNYFSKKLNKVSFFYPKFNRVFILPLIIKNKILTNHGEITQDLIINAGARPRERDNLDRRLLKELSEAVYYEEMY